MKVFRRIRMLSCFNSSPPPLIGLLREISLSTYNLSELEGVGENNLLILFHHNPDILEYILSHLDSVAESVRHRTRRLLLSLSYDKLVCESLLYMYHFSMTNYLNGVTDPEILESWMEICTNLVYNCPNDIDYHLVMHFYCSARENHRLVNCFLYLLLSLARCGHCELKQNFELICEIYFNIGNETHNFSSKPFEHEHTNFVMLLSILAHLCEVPLFYVFITLTEARAINYLLKQFKGPFIERAYQFLAEYLFYFKEEQVMVIVEHLELKEMEVTEARLMLFDEIVEFLNKREVTVEQRFVMREFLVGIEYEKLLRYKTDRGILIDQNVFEVCNHLLLSLES